MYSLEPSLAAILCGRWRSHCLLRLLPQTHLLHHHHTHSSPSTPMLCLLCFSFLTKSQGYGILLCLVKLRLCRVFFFWKKYIFIKNDFCRNVFKTRPTEGLKGVVQGSTGGQTGVYIYNYKYMLIKKEINQQFKFQLSIQSPNCSITKQAHNKKSNLQN